MDGKQEERSMTELAGEKEDLTVLLTTMQTIAWKPASPESGNGQGQETITYLQVS